jgi:Domain of unknown function (DUF3291)
MATIPWTSTARQKADIAGGTASVRAVVQVSQLELLHLRSVPGFLIAALRLRREVLRADGALGVSLIAQPWRKTFWTLSSWTGTEAIGGFTRSEAHRAVMVHYRDKMRGSHFHTWSNDNTERPCWPDAKTRLEQTRNDETG